MSGLGLEANEEIIGFLYLGSRDGAAKTIPSLDTADFVSSLVVLFHRIQLRECATMNPRVLKPWNYRLNGRLPRCA